MKRLLLHLAFNVPLGPLNPYIVGLAIGRWSHRASDDMVKKVMEKSR